MTKPNRIGRTGVRHGYHTSRLTGTVKASRKVKTFVVRIGGKTTPHSASNDQTTSDPWALARVHAELTENSLRDAERYAKGPLRSRLQLLDKAIGASTQGLFLTIYAAVFATKSRPKRLHALLTGLGATPIPGKPFLAILKSLWPAKKGDRRTLNRHSTLNRALVNAQHLRLTPSMLEARIKTYGAGGIEALSRQIPGALSKGSDAEKIRTGPKLSAARKDKSLNQHRGSNKSQMARWHINASHQAIEHIHHHPNLDYVAIIRFDDNANRLSLEGAHKLEVMLDADALSNFLSKAAKITAKHKQ